MEPPGAAASFYMSMGKATPGSSPEMLNKNKGEKENGNDSSAGRKNLNVGWGRISRMRNAGTSHHDWMADC